MQARLPADPAEPGHGIAHRLRLIALDEQTLGSVAGVGLEREAEIGCGEFERLVDDGAVAARLHDHEAARQPVLKGAAQRQDVHATRGEFLQRPFAVGIVAHGGSKLDVERVVAAQRRGGGGDIRRRSAHRLANSGSGDAVVAMGQHVDPCDVVDADVAHRHQARQGEPAGLGIVAADRSQGPRQGVRTVGEPLDGRFDQGPGRGPHLGGVVEDMTDGTHGDARRLGHVDDRRAAPTRRHAASPPRAESRPVTIIPRISSAVVSPHAATPPPRRASSPGQNRRPRTRPQAGG